MSIPLVESQEEAAAALRSGSKKFVIEMPPTSVVTLWQGRRPEVGLFIDGSEPFTGLNVRAYVTGVALKYVSAMTRSPGRHIVRPPDATTAAPPLSVEPRFAFNQEFKSIYGAAPGTIMITLMLIPAALTALGVVREKEIGSIINLYASPATVGRFLIGKQLPYVGVAMLSYLCLVLITVLVLGVPLKGSFLALSLGALCFLLAGTALGLLISTFVKSQVAAIFGTGIICLIPSANFSGLLYPVSTLTGAGYWVGMGFPASWFQLISLGCFTKGLGLDSFQGAYLALLGFSRLVSRWSAAFAWKTGGIAFCHGAMASQRGLAQRQGIAQSAEGCDADGADRFRLHCRHLFGRQRRESGSLQRLHRGARRRSLGAVSSLTLRSPSALFQAAGRHRAP